MRRGRTGARLAIATGLLAGCATAPADQETMTLCNADGCREVARDTATYTPPAPAPQAPPRDPARYRGADTAALEAMARAGDPHAAFFAGLNHAEGTGGPVDKQEAARWFRRAADAGVADAQYNLAMMKFRGDGVRRDSYGAIQMMRRAGENGDVRAQAALGRLYRTGFEEMGTDLSESRKWLALAAAQGDADSEAALAEVEAAIAAGAEAEERSPRWRDDWRDDWRAYWWRGRYYGWYHPRWRRFGPYHF